MGIRKNKAYTISFPVIDSTNRPTRLSGVTFASGDAKISKDGGAFASTTNTPTELGSTGRYKLDLTATELSADHVHITVAKSGIDDVDILYATGGQPYGSIVTDGGNTALTFKTDLSESTNDFWKDALILFTSGTLSGQVKKITGYTGATKFVSVQSAFTGTPSN